MSIKLLGTRILVSRIAAKLISVGGVHLSPAHVAHEKLWRVIQVGQGVEEIRAGDAVLVPDYGYRADVGDGQVILDQKECLAVIREDKS